MLEFRLLWGIGWYYEVVLYADADALLFFQRSQQGKLRGSLSKAKCVGHGSPWKAGFAALPVSRRLCSTDHVVQRSIVQAVQRYKGSAALHGSCQTP